MELNKMTSIREMLEQLPTQTLEEMLQKELHNEQVDGNTIRMIRDILRQRSPQVQVEISPQVRTAWETYRRKVEEQDEQARRTKKARVFALRAVSTAAILVLVVATFLPQTAEAETLWERLVRWTSGIAEFFSREDNEGREIAYEFKSDNPGLQQVYEAVVELGVTEPVVPSWLPEGSELLECKRMDTARKNGVMARFAIGNGELIFKIDCFEDEYAHIYHEDDTSVVKYENSEISHSIARNNNRWVVVWIREDKVECFITADCQEETLYEILESIYVVEEYE